MIAAPVPVGSRLTDSLQTIDAVRAQALKRSGIDGCVRYLGSVSPSEVGAIVQAGLGFMPVTFANHTDGKQAVAQCRALNLPKGVSVWLDVEGQAVWQARPEALITTIDEWAADVTAGEYMPCIYIGAPQPLTSNELWKLKVVRYWKGQGRTIDRTGALAEPNCGWCMTQMFPSRSWGGVYVDVNVVGQDYRRRVPTWAVFS